MVLSNCEGMLRRHHPSTNAKDVVMQRMLPLMVVVAATLGVGACGKGADNAKIVDAIKLQDVQWSKDYGAKDVNAIESHYASDGVLAGPGFIAENDVGRRQILSALMSDPNYNQTFTPDKVVVAKDGDLAVSRGHFQITMTDTKTNTAQPVPGSYLTVYQKQSDGSWKALARFLTRGPLANAAVEAKLEQSGGQGGEQPPAQ
jgi:ketosteroid isomerase-like protein